MLLYCILFAFYLHYCYFYFKYFLVFYSIAEIVYYLFYYLFFMVLYFNIHIFIHTIMLQEVPVFTRMFRFLSFLFYRNKICIQSCNFFNEYGGRHGANQ